MDEIFENCISYVRQKALACQYVDNVTKPRFERYKDDEYETTPILNNPSHYIKNSDQLISPTNNDDFDDILENMKSQKSYEHQDQTAANDINAPTKRGPAGEGSLRRCTPQPQPRRVPPSPGDR